MENKMMAMSVALRDVSRVAEEMTRGTITGESVDRKTVDAWANRLCEIISRDLAITLRNCDVGTADEQSERFTKYCKMFPICRGCECCGKVLLGRCELAWAQMPYEEEEGGAAQ